MRKILALPLLALVFSAAVLGALSVIPHAHGDDLDHSKHQTCPVYQQGLQDSSADVAACFTFGGLFLVAFVTISLQSPRTPTHRTFLSPRAPPLF